MFSKFDLDFKEGRLYKLSFNGKYNASKFFVATEDHRVHALIGPSNKFCYFILNKKTPSSFPADESVFEIIVGNRKFYSSDFELCLVSDFIKLEQFSQ